MKRVDPYKAVAAKRAAQMERIVFLVDSDTLARFDRWAADKGYASRTEALRAVVDEALRTEVRS